MSAFREVKYLESISKGNYFLVADIGGTNTNFGIIQTIDMHHILVLSLHFKSQEITHFTTVIQQVIAHCKDYGITFKDACLAAAGVISSKRDHVKPTNLSFTIDVHDIKQHTDLRCILLANDFEVIGYGLSLISPKDLVMVKKGNLVKEANKAILGAGTGLGKCIMVWEKHRKLFIPVASEGGHADAVIQTNSEYELMQFIKQSQARSCSVSWEDVLSGNGIQTMYSFFKSINQGRNANKILAKKGLNPDEIFKDRFLDTYCWETFEQYARFYGRCAKNFALDSLSRGGIYIAGGIAAKNLQLFETECFLQEFINCGKQQEILKEMPVYVITDYNVSLYGACEYLRVQGCP
jgi:glucokinase